MKSRLLIIIGMTGVLIFIVGISVASPSINNFDDFVYQLKEPFDGAEPEQIAQLEPELTTLPESIQRKPGLPPFTSDYYLDRELCKWELIPEPVISEAMPYIWNAYLQKRQMDFSPKEIFYWNTSEGWYDEKENKVCSPLILSDGTELYISSTFTVEPFKIIDTVISETQSDDCYKIWKTDTLLVEPSTKLGAWLENYWEKENEN